MSNRRRTGPMVHELPDHAAFVAVMSKLHHNQTEYFFFRLVRDRTTAIILRELAYWFDLSGKEPGYPRATIFRDGVYWVARTKKELLDAHGIERKEIERAYRQTEEFVATKNMKYRGDRITHWRFKLPRLLELLNADPIITKHRNAHSAGEKKEAASTLPPPPARTSRTECLPAALNPNISERHDPGLQMDIPQCAATTGEAAHPSIQPSGQRKQTLPTTGSAGPANAGTGGIPPSAPSGATAPEPPAPGVAFVRNGTLHPAPVLELLSSVRGLPWKEMRKRGPNGNTRAELAVGYMMVWQLIFEEEHPKRRCPFSDRDVERAWQLAEEEVRVKRFHEVLVEAHGSEGPSKGKNPVFMAQFHSYEFDAFCRHFTRIEGELVRVDQIEAG